MLLKLASTDEVVEGNREHDGGFIANLDATVARLRGHRSNGVRSGPGAGETSVTEKGSMTS